MRSGHVYVMDMGGGRIKVGCSNAPAVRAATLRAEKLLYQSPWTEHAERVERAAHRILKAAGHHLRCEIFSASLEEALAAIELAVDKVSNGDFPVRRPTKRRKKMVGYRLNADLMDRVEAFRAAQRFRPTLTAVVEKALRDYLSEREQRP